MKSFTISENDAGQRADKFLKKALPALPQSMLYRCMRQKKIKLNRRRCEPSSYLNIGDILEVYLPDTLLAQGEKKRPSAPKLPRPDIIYEDLNLLIADKPSGLPCHSGSGGKDTLVDRIIRYLTDTGAYLPDSSVSFAPALCNRLDRNTAGLVIAAKNAAALRLINACIRDGGIIKKYLCRVSEKPPKQEDILTAYHRKDEKNNTALIADNPADGFRRITTGYRVLSADKGLYLLEVTLFTGRSHQIRAHLAHIGCPIVGDMKYGGIPNGGRGQELCAYSLEFRFHAGSPLEYLNSLSLVSNSGHKFLKQGTEKL